MFPNTYQENSRQEIEILRLADNFLRQFEYIYPDRIKPPLYLENECKVNKLVCTTLCPFKVKMPTKMRQWDYCANFFIDFFDYEILCPPTDCPQKLLSVDTILKRRKGNSLDLSTVLCTFLLASDYDVYVVQGYVRRNICEKLENNKPKPPITFDTNSEYHKQFFTDAKTQDESVTENKYEIDFELLKSFWLEGKSVFQPEKEPEPAPVPEEFEEDIYLGKRVHFWILIFTYENGSSNTYFIEPTTGEQKVIDDLDYLGIEFVWNNKNFWCNNQPLELSCKNINFDLNDPTMWEPFLPEYSINEEYDKSIRMPNTWVKDVEITEEDLSTQLPKEGRIFYYKMATIVKYNPGSSSDGIVYHATYYKTKEKEEKEESHDFFSKRKDFLEYRMTDFTKELVKDIFALGRTDSLKEHVYPLGGISYFPQKLEFYTHLRKDQLSSRTWSDAMTLDEFTGRSDLLVTRKVDFFKEKDPSQRDLEDTESGKDIPLEITESLKENSEELEESVSQSSVGVETSKETMKTTGSKEKSKEEILSEIEEHHEEVETESEEIEVVSEVETKSEEIEVESVEVEAEREEVEAKSEEVIDARDYTAKGITPSSFEVDYMLFETVDFNTWKFEYFLNSIDPSERYATSDSEEEEEERSEHATEEVIKYIPQNLEDVENSEERSADYQQADEDVSQTIGEQTEIISKISEILNKISESAQQDYENEETEVLQYIDEETDQTKEENKESGSPQQDDERKGHKAKSKESRSQPQKENISQEYKAKVEESEQSEERSVDYQHADDDVSQTIGEQTEIISKISEILNKISELESPQQDYENEETEVLQDENEDNKAKSEKSISRPQEDENEKHKAKSTESVSRPQKGESEEHKAKIKESESHSQENESEERESFQQDHKSETKVDTDNVTEDSTPEKHEERRGTEGELDREMDIYDEINFDALSDEELEIDYQLFLSKLWKDYNRKNEGELFYMQQEYKNYKDLRDANILKLKKKIMRKRRNNVRYMQRVQSGKPHVRFYKNKSVHISERQKSVYTNDLMNYLDLKGILKINNAADIKEFHEIDELEKPHMDLVDAEIIKKESLLLIDKKLKRNKSELILNNMERIRSIKNTYLRDLSLPVEHDIENIWFDFEVDCYRLDFHYPTDRSSRKILIFNKPESGSTDFRFSDVFCRQILPSYMTKPIKRSQLYSYIVTLMKKEPLVLRQYESLQKEMKELLDVRQREEKNPMLQTQKKTIITLESKQYEEEHQKKIKVEPKERKDIISYTMEILKFSTPLSETESKMVYKTIFDEFCKETIMKLNCLERGYEEATQNFEAFLENCKKWDEELTDEKEKSFIEACGTFSAQINSIKYRCDAQRETTKTNFFHLKKKLYYDPRLQAFIKN